MIDGNYFDGRTSTPHPAQLEIGADGLVRVIAQAGAREAPLASVRISDRLGRTPRRIRFEDGALFETSDNDAVDAALEARGHRSFARRINGWQRRWQVAIGALLAVAILSVLFVRYGAALLANVAAHTLPGAVDRTIGVQGLDILDRSLLKPSTLPVTRQKALRNLLRQMTVTLVDGHNYRLELRHGGSIGANAFALPDGIIVVTDELVALSKNDEEIIAVLAHGIGHVRGRHALRTLLENTGVAAITLTVFGDVNSMSALAASVPAVLLNARNSRDFEREADAFARRWLRDHSIPQRRFDDLLCRLQQASPSRPDISYLISHPPTEERASCDAPTVKAA